ncbi:MAG: acetyl/propionyl/methylcrotonyl-CoA carboxylase subunit alpha [Rudaea sp.]
MFKSILVANRGEIACRVIRTCRRLGIHTVAVYSEADATAQHVRQADEAWPIGGPQPADSYLRGDAIIEVAKKSGAQAIHPGYGFVSENADFAEAVEHAGLVFIGPSAASMRKMGSKAGAKDLMSGHGVPVVPGYTGEDQDAELLAREAERIAYPLMVKAAYGGGGKGMRIVRSAGEFASALASCQREAKSAFGRDRVLLERYIETPRHIEFQIFGDHHGNMIHLNERECSAQRRYQKVLEEAPSPFLTPELRTRMGEAAIAAGRALGYVNAGTVEFIVGAKGDFYFMEINTRLQVEHPVTEMTLHLDLVELQLRVAAGEALPGSLIRNKSVPADGHSIELRLYAEDPQAGFLPGSGKLTRLHLPPSSEHVRVDGGVIQGDTVTIFYDPMIAKLIVWDRSRDQALQRMREALAQCEVVGPKSNIDFLERLVRHPVVVDGTIDTGYLDRNLPEFLPVDREPDPLSLFAAASAVLLDEENLAANLARTGTDPYSPWARADAWRIGHHGKRLVCFKRGDQRIEIDAHGSAGDYKLTCGKHHGNATNVHFLDGKLNVCLDGIAHRFDASVDEHCVVLHDGIQRRRFSRIGAFAVAKSAQQQTDSIVAPMPGRIVLVKAKAGDAVVESQELIVMEAMKMELTLRAPRDTMIAELQASTGEFVEADAILVRFEDAK